MAQHLLIAECPSTWRALKIPLYLYAFITNMEDRTDRKNIWCRMFRRAFTGDTIVWYRTLLARSIHTYEDLEKAFRTAFAHQRKRLKYKATLLTVKKGDFESTQEYIDRFASEV